MNTVALTAGAIALQCLPGVLLVAALIALYGAGKGLVHVARQINHILRDTDTRKETPKP